MQKHILLFLLTLIINLSLQAQGEAPFEIEEVPNRDGSVTVYATNPEPYPITITIDLSQKENMKCRSKLPIKTVLAVSDEPQLLMELEPINRKKAFSYAYGFQYFIGDAINAKHDDDYAYLLPYEKGETYRLDQGYHGHYSHKGVFALDFNMKVGDKICAARGGLVVEVKEGSNKGCSNPKCKNMANYMLVLHDDGSMASYVHLKYKGALVEVGDRVEAGDVIALSGNTGWSRGPHLHFSVYLPTFKGDKTLATKFLVEEKKVRALKVNQSYTAVR